ncbi:hypothetical protein [Halococcus agarilyticus]|uniref:hypothetical protein n=1 Tax=Halococcus agarilyticus TaxID=1232219 RepID=UPI0012ABF96F|nr:hypothetical protein [Halococcus agarilyticus]
MVVTLSTVLAGCAGVIDSAEERANDAVNERVNEAVNDTFNDTMGGVLNASAVGNLTDVPTNVTPIGFGFDRPETYTYEIAMGQGDLPSAEGRQARGQLVVDVQEASDETATLTTRYELDGKTMERPIAGTQEEVAFGFMNVTQATNASPALTDLQTHMNLAATLGTSLYLAGYVTPIVKGQPLPSGADEAVKYETKGTDSYAGVECSVTELSINGTRSAESCVSTNLGLPAYVVLYDENATADTWIELVKYERP